VIRRDGRGGFGFALPGELYTKHLLGEESDPHVDMEYLATLVAERYGTYCAECSAARFETISVVESRGTVQPESFTHGTSEQRVRWFRRGIQTGSIQQCNTFEARQL